MKPPTRHRQRFITKTFHTLQPTAWLDHTSTEKLPNHPINTLTPTAPTYSPEQELLAYTLYCALHAYSHGDPLENNWFHSTNYQPFSFLWICDKLHLSPQTILSRLPHTKPFRKHQGLLFGR